MFRTVHTEYLVTNYREVSAVPNLIDHGFSPSSITISSSLFRYARNLEHIYMLLSFPVGWISPAPTPKSRTLPFPPSIHACSIKPVSPPSTTPSPKSNPLPQTPSTTLCHTNYQTIKHIQYTIYIFMLCLVRIIYMSQDQYNRPGQR